MNRVLMSTVLSLCLALGLFSAPMLAADLATVSMGSGGIAWQPTASAASWVLTVTGPENFYLRQEFDSAPSMDFFTADGQLLADGLYRYELRAIPHISPQLRQELDAAAGDLEQRERLAARVQDLGGVQSGSFRIEQGSLVTADRAELGPETLSNATSAEVPTMELDQVFLDDVIVDGSLCVGFDCVNGESFGFDTIRLKENNLRIHFDDTSSSGSFPSNDWRLTANDSANGGLSRFTIEDATAGRNVFTIEAAARSNSLYVDSSGRVGIGTSSPVVEAHVSDGDSPALRLEQNGSSGFTPQTWDVAGNETNFFVRDVTNGSTLPFRVRPGAPTSSIDIASDGDVGIGTSSPGVLADGSQAALHVRRTDGDAVIYVEDASSTEDSRILLDLTNNGQVRYVLRDTSADGEDWEISNLNSGFNISLIGSGGPEIVVAERDPSGATNVMTVDGDIAAVDFNMTSSRELKTGLKGLNTRQVLDRLMDLDMFEWSFTSDPSSVRHLGPMAEDFHDVFRLSSDKKHISLVDSNGVALAAIQGLHQMVMEKDQKIVELKEALTGTQRQIDELKALVESLVQSSNQP